MNKPGGDAYVLQPGEGKTIDLGGFGMSVMARSETTGGAFALLEAAEPPGFGPPMHVHTDAAEAFYVLEGEYMIFLEGRELLCPAGSFIYIPAGAVHGFKVGNRRQSKAQSLLARGDGRLFRGPQRRHRQGESFRRGSRRDSSEALNGDSRSGAGRLHLTRRYPRREGSHAFTSPVRLPLDSAALVGGRRSRPRSGSAPTRPRTHR